MTTPKKDPPDGLVNPRIKGLGTTTWVPPDPAKWTMPSAADMKAYGDIDPTFPARIAKLVENERAHQHRMKEMQKQHEIEVLAAARSPVREFLMFLTVSLILCVVGVVCIGIWVP